MLSVRVLFIGECPHVTSSAGKVTYYLSAGLVREGFDVVVACYGASRHLFGRELVMDGEYGSVGFTQYTSLINLWRRYSPDVMILYGTPFAPPTHDTVSEVGKYVEYAMGRRAHILGYFLCDSLVLPRGYVASCTYVDGIASPTRASLEVMLEGMRRLGIGEDVLRGSSFVVGHGVDMSVWRGGCRDCREGYFVFGMMGKSMERKDFGCAVEAFGLLPDHVRGCSVLKLVPVGFLGSDNAWDIELLVDAVSAYVGADLHGRVVTPSKELLGWGLTEYELVREVSTMDVFLFLTRGESFGIPPLEAGALGIPTLVTDIPVMREVMEGLPDYAFIKCREYLTPEGLMLCMPDPKHASEAMKHLFESDTARKALADKAHAIASKRSWDKAVKEMVKAIEAITSQEPKLLSSLTTDSWVSG